MSGLSVGSHIRVARMGYLHHGLYVGCDQVIHYGGSDHGEDDAPNKVRRVRLSTFSAGSPVWVVAHHQPRYNAAESVARARERLGEDDYSLVFNNCEHFVNWCIEGESSSTQVKLATTAAVLGVTQAARSLAAREAAVVVGGQLARSAGASVLTGSLGSALGAGAAASAVVNPVGVVVVGGALAGYAVSKLVSWLWD